MLASDLVGLPVRRVWRVAAAVRLHLAARVLRHAVHARLSLSVLRRHLSVRRRVAQRRRQLRPYARRVARRRRVLTASRAVRAVVVAVGARLARGLLRRLLALALLVLLALRLLLLLAGLPLLADLLELCGVESSVCAHSWGNLNLVAPRHPWLVLAASVESL